MSVPAIRKHRSACDALRCYRCGALPEQDLNADICWVIYVRRFAVLDGRWTSVPICISCWRVAEGDREPARLRVTGEDLLLGAFL